MTYTPPFRVEIVFDAWPKDIAIGETPHQRIRDGKERHVMQLEEDALLPGGRAVEDAPSFWRWEGRWSTDVADWQPTPLALRIVEWLNQEFAQP